jgi:hypothetical protein
MMDRMVRGNSKRVAGSGSRVAVDWAEEGFGGNEARPIRRRTKRVRRLRNMLDSL